MSFTYFKSPREFAFMADSGQSCHFCSSSIDCLDGGNLFGQEDIEAVCFNCMLAGKLINLAISANDVDEDQIDPSIGDPDSISNEIVYRTPSIPSWQDISWPVKNGKPYQFVKIASRVDYESKEQFVSSLFDCDPDPDLWEMLPDHIIANLKDGQYDVSFYLFELDGEKLTLWDAN